MPSNIDGSGALQKSTKGRRKLLIIIGAAALIACIGLFFLEENWRGNPDWEAQKAYMKAHNLPLDWTPPKPHHIPPDQNFAETPFLRAVGYTNQVDTNIWRHFQTNHSAHLAKYIGKNGKFSDLPSYQNELRQNPYLNLPRLPRDPALDLLDSLKIIEPEMNELRQASLRPQSAFTIQGTNPFTADTIHYSAVYTIAQVFSLAASAELALEKPNDGFRDLAVVYQLAEAIKPSDAIRAMIFREFILKMHAQIIWEGWALNQWTEAQWLTIQKQYHEVDFLMDFDRCLRMGEIGAINHMLNNYAVPELIRGLRDDSPPLKFDLFKWMNTALPHSWVRKNQIIYNKFMESLILAQFDASAQRVYPHIQVACQTKLSDEFNQPIPNKIIAVIAISRIALALEYVARSQTWIKQTEIVCALERYRLKNGSYPETLQQLIPKFIENLPHDLITGEPYKYHVLTNGQFALYSVGWNEKDDGGAAATNANGKRPTPSDDWVWPEKPL